MLHLAQIGDLDELIVGFGDGDIKLYAIDLHEPKRDNASLHMRQAFEKKHSSHVYSLIRFQSAQDENTLVASASHDKNIVVWSRQAKSKENFYPEFKYEATLESGHSSHVNELIELKTDQSNSSGKTMASCSADGTIIVWRLDDEKKKFVKTKTLLAEKNVVGLETLIYVPTHEELVSAYFDRSTGHSLVHVWSTKTVNNLFEFEDKQIIQLKSNVWSLLELAIKKDSKSDGASWIVSGHQNGSICLWTKKNTNYELRQTFNDDVEIRDQQQHTNEIRSLLELEHNHDLISGSLFKIVIYAFDVSNGEFQLKQTLNKHDCFVWCLVSLLKSKEDKAERGMFASGSDDKTIKIWS